MPKAQENNNHVSLTCDLLHSNVQGEDNLLKSTSPPKNRNEQTISSSSKANRIPQSQVNKKHTQARILYYAFLNARPVYYPPLQQVVCCLLNKMFSTLHTRFFLFTHSSHELWRSCACRSPTLIIFSLPRSDKVPGWRLVSLLLLLLGVCMRL